MPWVKLYTKALDDPKLGRVSERVRWRFVQLVLMAGECDAEGYLVNGDRPMSTDDIAWRLRLNPTRCASDMASLESIGVIANGERGWFLPKFGSLQGRSQSQKREVWKRNQSSSRAKHNGAESESEENTDKSIPVINDSDMTHTPREEKRRVEKKTPPGAQPAPDVPDALKSLAAVFEKASGIKLEQIEKRERGATYWQPLSVMLKAGNGSAEGELRAAVVHLRQRGLNISSPKSILKTFNSLHGAKLAPADGDASTQLHALGYTDADGNPV